MKPATESQEPTAESSPPTIGFTPWWKRVSFDASPAKLAMGLFGLACLIGLAVVAWPQAAGIGGLAFLIGITLCGSALILALTSGRLVPAESPARLFGTALDTDQRACCITLPDGSVAYANPAWRKLFGRSISGGDLLPVAGFSSDAETAQRLYALVRSSSLKEAREEELKLKNVAGKWVHVAVSPISQQGHTVWRITDSSPRRPMLQSVDTSPRQSVVVQIKPVERPPGQAPVTPQIPKFIFDAPLAIALVSADGVILDASAAMTSIVGLELSKLKGKTIYSLLQGTAERDMRARLSFLKVGDVSRAPIQASFDDVKTGGKRTAQIFAGRFDPEENAGAGYAIYMMDTTGQTALENQYAQSQKHQAIGHLAAGIAHDFNNLLTVINGTAELLIQKHTPGDPSFQDLNTIHNTGVRAASIVRQLLAFSRQQQLEPQVLNLTDLVADWTITLRRLIGERVKLKTEHGRDLWPVLADPNQLGNALINLSVNARDAMPNGGSLIVRTRNLQLKEDTKIEQATMPTGDYVVIEVEDTGIGIAKENLSKVFGVYFTTKEPGKGTGLGLSSVYGIVKQSGGYIFVDSEVGKGTTFRIYLPRHTAPIVSKPVEPVKPPRDLTGEETVLLVEDEDQLRELAKRGLMMRGYKVVEACNGEEALEIFEAHGGKFDLVVSDVVMNPVDGPTLIKEIRKQKPDMRCILMSGYAQDALAKNPDLAGKFHYLAKPFKIQELQGKVKEVLQAE
jgi:two-component system cell cycle sensor histidine kinase/response regulator CckA